MDSEYARPPPNPDVYQTPEVDIKGQWDEASVKNKTFLITGGASGFGAGWTKKLAGLGATVIIGDLQNGQPFIGEIRKATGNPNLHYVKCDVTDYKSQCDMFRKALELSPKKAIDSVVANAGVSECGMNFRPQPFVPGQAEDPPKPNLLTMDVNTTGVIYTVYLALQYLRGHPHLKKDAYPNADHDRSILLIGSIASLYSLTHAVLYNASKHSVLGIYRSLRMQAKPDRIRINLLCPYWVNTPIIPIGAKLLLAGNDLADIEDVIDIGVRCLGDYSVAGHIFLILPRSSGGVVEIFNDEPKALDAFNRNAVIILNKQSAVGGFIRWARDIVYAFAGWTA
ncbi:hypothetical protein ABW19_dt0206750 [Dactylella cylindrospora]|nr:hypothetical protein ABW19_dt0206750 [Dactylella cylindrospora]